MITLGIELSSRQGSVALLNGCTVLAEKSWRGERVRHNTIFQTLDDLLAAAEISYCGINCIAVGRGPGSFSGMRMAFAIAQALALPGAVAVRAVSSGAALARAAARDGAKKIAVVGDARRGQVWIGQFCARPDGTIDCPADWALVPYTDISIPADSLVVSPEAERLTEWFPDLGAARFPLASDVAALALAAEESEPLEPLYMHPPVFIEPKFN